MSLVGHTRRLAAFGFAGSQPAKITRRVSVCIGLRPPHKEGVMTVSVCVLLWAMQHKCDGLRLKL